MVAQWVVLGRAVWEALPNASLSPNYPALTQLPANVHLAGPQIMVQVLHPLAPMGETQSQLDPGLVVVDQQIKDLSLSLSVSVSLPFKDMIKKKHSKIWGWHCGTRD